MGLYYSLYEWYNPLWLTDKKRYVAEHMFPQLKDLVNRYAPAVLFTDGEWDLPSADWRSPELLAWLLNESPCREALVVNDRWGKECRHQHGGYWTTEYTAGLPGGAHPWEEGRALASSFGYSRTESLEDYRTSQELVWMLIDLVSRGGNLLLGIGPTADGRIPVIMQDRLAEMGQWLKLNGEAIYGSHVWTTTCQWTDGEQPKQGFGQYRLKYEVAKLVGMHSVEGQARKQAFFTTRPGTLYAILPRWPGKTFTLKGVKLDAAATVRMLGVEGTLAHQVGGGDTVIQMPQLNVDQLPCKYAWTLKISGGGQTGGRGGRSLP
jgi:alpha-L-fucosidase